ncbi:MAG TPA: SNF2-related protein [Candidatus Limnocylindria bacterium]|nr:SNF2-related protein [Candidatus Limnocylindria bacterium]
MNPAKGVASDRDKRLLMDAAQGVLPEGAAVSIRPLLRLDGDSLSVSLRVGEGRPSYIRDLPGFLRAVERREAFPVSKGFTYTPAWMTVDPDMKRLLRLLMVHLESAEAAGQPLPAANRRDVALMGALRGMVLDCLNGVEFTLALDGGKHLQDGIEETALPLLFRAGYDIRGVVLRGSWQENVARVTSDGRYALVGSRLVALGAQDSALLRALPQLPAGEEFEFRFTRDETPRVFAELLPWLTRSQPVVMEEALSERLLRYPLKSRVYLDREGDGIAAKVLFDYGPYTADPFTPGGELPAYLFRDAPGERELMDLLGQYGFRARTGRADLQDPNLIFAFLTDGVARLDGISQVFLSHGFRLLTPRAPRLSGFLRMKEGRVSLEMYDGDEQADELLPLLQALSKGRKYYRYRNGAFITLTGEGAWQGLARAYLESVREEDGRDLPAMRAFYLHALIEKTGLPVQVDEETGQALRLDSEQAQSPVEGLYEYQKRGFRWIESLDRLGLGGILADEMGLGKTAQTIAAIAFAAKERPATPPSLIVSPTTLLFNWVAEFQRFAPGMDVRVIHGGRAVRERLLAQAMAGGADVVITSYPLLRQDLAMYRDIKFRYAVLDEAQNIKNFTSQTAHAVKRLSARTRLALTGTPMENNVSELWSLFDYVLPGYLGSARDFLRRYEDGRASDELRMRIRPFMLRRVKSDVMQELPDKLEDTMYCEMDADQRRVYRAALLKSRAHVHELLEKKGLDASRVEVLAAITQLRQICCHPRLVLQDYGGESAKLEMLMEVLPEAIAEGRRMLVFSQFTTMLRIIRERLDRAGISSLYLDGETPAQERLELAEKFNRGTDPVFLVSLKAGGTGLNLTGADMVIHFDPWWNPTAEDQANDRAHRLGQEKAVQILHLVTLRSIEEAVVEMGRRKRRLFDRLITPGEKMPQKLSREDVLNLFAR